MRLEDYLKENHISQVRFSALVKIHPVQINRFIKGKHLPSLPSIRKIERATNGQVKTEDFYTENE